MRGEHIGAMAANKVIRSIEAPGGQLCVDLFRRPDGSFGFELYRREPEESIGWFAIGHYAEKRFADLAATTEAAGHAIPWSLDT